MTKPKKNRNITPIVGLTPAPAVATAKKSSPNTATEEKTGGAPKRDLLIWAALALTFFAFLPTFQNDFVDWDDPVNITENADLNRFDGSHIQAIFTHTIIGNYNPLPIFTFAIEKAIFGAGHLAEVIHTDNLILHLICVFLVYRLSILMGASRWAAFLIALFFGVHPMRVESVAWATERKDVLMGVFYLTALILYVRYLKEPERNRRLFYWIIPVFLLALLAKVQSVALPLSMLALDYYFNRPLKWNLVWEKLVFFLGSLFFGAMGVYFLKQANSINDNITHYGLFDRALIASHSFAVYCVKLIFPYMNSALYTYPAEVGGPEFYLSVVWLLGTLYFIWYGYRRGWNAIVFGLAFFLVNFIFVSQLVGAGQGYLADRFTYIPYFGFFFLVVITLDRWAARRFGKEPQPVKSALKKGNLNVAQTSTNSGRLWMNLGLGVFAALFMGMTYRQTETWQNGGTLWTHALEYQPNQQTSLPYANRGIYYRDQKQLAEAKRDFLKAISFKSGAGPYNSLGKLYFDQKPPVLDSAIYYYTLGIAKDSTISETWTNLGSAYGMSGAMDKAVENLDKALHLDSLNQNALMNRSLAYQNLKKFDLALKDDDLFLRLNRDNPDMWFDRALVKRNLNLNKEALPDFDEAVRLKPEQPVYLLERAKCYFALGDKTQAKTDAQGAVAKGISLTAADQGLLQ